MVGARTKDLDVAMKVFVGRELKIRDLEKKINELEGKKDEFTSHQ